jgi:hypothetical protein
VGLAVIALLRTSASAPSSWIPKRRRARSKRLIRYLTIISSGKESMML